jgi:hypothetical protein
VAIAFKIGILDLSLEFLAHTLIFGFVFTSARAISASLL